MSNIVFNIPELLLGIFSFLSPPKSGLYAPIQVNRRWFEYGISIIWCCYVPCDALDNVHPSRRYIYASQIRAMNVIPASDHFKIPIPGIPHLNLTSLSLHGYDSGVHGFNHLSRYMQGTLKYLDLRSCLIDSTLVQHLKRHCPQLRKVTINLCDLQPSLSFLEFLESIQSLGIIEASCFESNIDIAGALTYLATQRNLKSLSLDYYITEGSLSELPSPTPPTFHYLQSLTLTLTAEAVPAVVKMARHLDGDLSLDIFHKPTHAFSQISQLTGLRELKLRLYRGTDLPRDEIMSLAALSNLEQLIIIDHSDSSPNPMESITAPGFTDGDFDSLVSHFPRLRLFQAALDWDISGHALLSLGKHCPEIELIHTALDFNVTDIKKMFPKKSAPMFPFLTILGISGIHGDDCENFKKK